MANINDVGEATCKCGIMYNRFVSNECPLCKLRKYIERTKQNYNGDGWNGST